MPLYKTKQNFHKSQLVINKLYQIFRGLLIIICLPHSINAKPTYDSLFHQSYAVRSVYFDQAIASDWVKLTPVAYLQKLDVLQQRAKKEQDYGAELEVIIGRFQFRDYANLIALDEKIARLEKLLKTLDLERYPEYRAVIMDYLAQNYYGKKRNYTLAFEHFINAYNIATQFTQKDFPDKKQLLVGLGNRYYTIGDYEKAKRILLEADSLNHPWDKFVTYNEENTLGLIYRSFGYYDTAINYFEQSKKHALADGNKIWAAIASGNIGISYYQQQDYDKAIPLLEEDIKSSFSTNKAMDNGINSLLILADIHLHKNDLTSVAADIRLAQQYLDSCRDKIKPLGMLYPVMAQYYFKKGDYKTAYSYQDSAAIYKDVLYERDNIYKLAKVEHKKDLEKVDTEIKRLSAEKKLLSFTRNGLLIGIVLLFIITGLIINRQRLKHHLKQVAMLAKKVQAEHDLKAATRGLENFTRHLQEKNLLIEQSGQEIERLRIALDDTEQETNEVLQQIYSTTILTDEEWTRFKLLFEQVHKGYLQRLKNKMPELTPADTRFIVLSKLNLSNKEMAGILGVQADTIRSYKHRLRRRFDLPEDASIKEFVDSI
ncbi:MAG: tetratricopeptide repeat protein [Taibaiella sp.]|jgi:DNA-binding CsgD family transcriptional regulator